MVRIADFSSFFFVFYALVCLLIGSQIVAEAVGDMSDNDRAKSRFPLTAQIAAMELDMLDEEDTCPTENQKIQARKFIMNDVQEQLKGLPPDLIPCDKRHTGRVKHCAVDNCSVLFQQTDDSTSFFRFSGIYWLKLSDQEPQQVYCNRETGYPEVASCSLLFAYHPPAESGYYTLLLRDGARIERVYCNRETGLPEPESCGQAHQLELPSGAYTLRPPPQHIPLNHTVFCDMNHEECSGNNTEWWTRIASLNMSDTNNSCPSNWNLIDNSSIRACSRRAVTRDGCDSVILPALGHSYTKVCGRIVGHQAGRELGFWPLLGLEATIDDPYLGGVSITHGSPLNRTHIWSFASNLGDVYCPCSSESSSTVSGNFMGNNYFCEMGVQGQAPPRGTFDQIYPLWDGETCAPRDTCCRTNNPPWFTADLLQPTTNDIEIRICGISAIDVSSTAISLMDIYIH